MTKCAIIPSEPIDEILELVSGGQMDVLGKGGGIRARVLVIVVWVGRVCAVGLLLFRHAIREFHGGQIRHVDYADDAVCTVDQHLATIAGQTEEGDDTCAKFCAVDYLTGLCFDDIDVAF